MNNPATGGRARSRWSVIAPEGQGATFVELFFDLVFVFAVTQVTKFTEEHLTWSGVARAVLIFWLIWWAWTQFTWALNPADTNHGAVRMGTLVATAVAFLMAVGVEDAFGDEVLWFVVPYVVVRLIGIGLYLWVLSAEREQLAAVRTFALLSLFGLTAALAGGLVDSPAREWFWLATIVLDLVAAGVAGNRAGWGLHAPHFAERHGLFVIIALGESLIVAGTLAAAQERTAELVTVAVGAVVATCLLWWTYFGWLKDDLEAELERRPGAEQARLARDAYSFLHFPLIGGVIGVAVGYQEMVAHPGDELPSTALAALAVGLVLFLWSAAAAVWRAERRVLVVRLLVGGVLVLALWLLSDVEPGWILLAVSAALLVIVAVEQVTEARARLAATPGG